MLAFCTTFQPYIPEGNILIVGHAGSHEVCSWQLLSRHLRNEKQFSDICTQMPYCGILACQEDPVTRRWRSIESPILTLTHSANKKAVVRKLLFPT